jgi:low temperature requirement protein LtrA
MLDELTPTDQQDLAVEAEQEVTALELFLVFVFAITRPSPNASFAKPLPPRGRGWPATPTRTSTCRWSPASSSSRSASRRRSRTRTPTSTAFPAAGLCGGVALYLLALSTFKRRNIGSFNWPRQTAVLVLGILAPVATRLPGALISLGLVAAVACGLIAFETWRYAETRDRIRHGS